MNHLHKIAVALFAVSGFASFESSAITDSAAPVIQLRATCNDGFGGELNNCFTSFPGVVNWINNTRLPAPSQTAPLLVEIGPGTFPGSTEIICGTQGGFMTFRGAGRGVTKLANFSVDVCQKMIFESLTVESDDVFTAAVQWGPSGSSTWTNVELKGPGQVWYDQENAGPCDTELGGKHEWFSSTIRTIRSTNIIIPITATYTSWCGDSWFWGSEIENLNIGASGNGRALAARSPGASIHFYGGNIRMFSDSNSAKPLKAIEAIDGGAVHVHGSGIDVESLGNAAVTALSASNGGEIHAAGVGYVLRTGPTGTATRIENIGATGHVHAPYHWEHIPDTDGNPHSIDTNFTSANGVDQTTLIAADGFPRLVVFSTTCAQSNNTLSWYDPADKVCRGQLEE